MLALVGVTASDCTLAAGTVMVAVERCPLNTAVTVAVPGDTGLTTPALTVAVAAALLLQVAVLVTSFRD
jgi:hypothetical protein